MASFEPETARSRGDPDAPHVTPVTPDEDMRTILINRISWGAVFGGVVIALATYEQQYRQAVEEAKQQATAAAQTATTAVSRGALLSSIALLLGALAAWLGGHMGAVDPTITTRDVMETRRPHLH
jgi:hypothetical protein